MDLVRMRDAIVAGLRARLGEELANFVDAHTSSDFLVPDVEAALSKNNYVAVRVMYLGVADDPEKDATGVTMPNTWAIFVCAKDGAKDKVGRNDRILALLPEVFAAVKANDWDVGDDETLGKPARIRVRPYYQGTPDKTASIAAWGVTWRVSTSFEDAGAGDEDADIRPLKFLLTRWDLAPKDGVIDATDDVRFPETP